jgi:23S rRNA (guanosine2251-2'-O)-methyltransferase
MSSHRRPGGRRRPQSRLERLHGRHVLAAALASGRRRIERLLVAEDSGRSDVEPLIARARTLGVPVVTVERQSLGDLVDAGEAGLQGAVLEAGPLPELSDVGELARPSGPDPGRRLLVALDGVEDPRNLGAIARVADAAGATGLLLTERRAPPLGAAASRASAGALEWLPVGRVPNLARALEVLKDLGFWVVAADPDAAETVFEVPDRLLSGDLVVVLGAEGRGLRPSIRERVDHPLRIPMQGRVESLNVSTAAAVLLFEVLRRAGRDGPEAIAGEGSHRTPPAGGRAGG